MPFVIEELGTPFPDSFEKMAANYFFAKWSLTGVLEKGLLPEGVGKKIKFKVGFPDYKKPFEVNFIKLRTEAKAETVGEREYNCLTYMDVALRMSKLPRDTYINRELHDMEEEFSRICAGYEKDPQDIVGVKNLIWGGDERIYGGNDTYATSNWRSMGHFAFWYRKEWIDDV